LSAVLRTEEPRGWSERSSALGTRIHDALGTRALDIEHNGNASGPGLAAEPIVDVLVLALVLVSDVEDESPSAPALQAAGFLQRLREPGHRQGSKGR
jgi:GrpB-like predicted nucleotidyltransferase (UPF0157 family)